MSPTQRSLALLRKEGWEPFVVERWSVRHSGKQLNGRQLFWLENRIDLFNFADILAIKAGEPHLLVQTTSGSNAQARVKKIIAEPRALLWVRSGGLITVHGWRKLLRKRGGKAKYWSPLITDVTEEMFDAEEG